MPAYDLRDPNGALDPLAPCKVLAVMCEPTDRKMRERVLAPIQRETAAQTPRAAGLGHGQFMREVQLRGNRAGLAGGLLLTRAMSKLPARQPQQPKVPGPHPIGCENAEGTSTERQTLLALARLLGRQAAREFILQEQRTNDSINEPPVEDV